MPTQEEELEKARRNYDTAVAKVGKATYLSGNGGEKMVSVTYRNYVRLNNQSSDRPQLMLPKKKYRRG